LGVFLGELSESSELELEHNDINLLLLKFSLVSLFPEKKGKADFICSKCGIDALNLSKLGNLDLL
jgi:hypothetical protein